MNRYRLICCKRGLPFTKWEKTEENARHVADCYRKAGYTVNVWVYGKEGSRRAGF